MGRQSDLLSCDGWAYTWDAENRLAKAVKRTTWLEFGCDAVSRRISRKVYESNTLASHERDLYDGFKLIAAYNVKNTCTQIAAYLWQPFGGEDVPIIMRQGSNRYFYLTDGKMNITSLFDTSGTRAAMYLYGPFW